jgi:hypothetical protein
VSNTYTIYLVQGDSLGKLRIIPHSFNLSHDRLNKAEAVQDECADD